MKARKDGIKVVVELLEPFDYDEGRLEITLQDNTLSALVDELSLRYPGFGDILRTKDKKVAEDIMILVNGVNAFGDLSKKIEDNDTVVFSRTVSGG